MDARERALGAAPRPGYARLALAAANPYFPPHGGRHESSRPESQHRARPRPRGGRGRGEPAVGRRVDAPASALAGGVAAIQRFARLAPAAPGVYRMIDQKGEVLYVGKAKSIRKRITSYARQAGHTARIMRMIAATATHRVRLDHDRDRGAAARSEPDQAAASALQRADARRQVVPLHIDHGGRDAADDREASRRAQQAGRVLRAVRLGAGRAPDHHGAGARVPDPLVLGHRL